MVMALGITDFIGIKRGGGAATKGTDHTEKAVEKSVTLKR
jgi:hypothetical protein